MYKRQIVNYNGSAAKAEEVVREITEAGGTAEAIQCSVSDYEKTEEMMKDLIARYKRIDILVNNAGITKDNPVSYTHLDVYKRQPPGQ